MNCPYLGASPDGLVKCACCGPGLVEIKCPWCAKDATSLEDVAEHFLQRGLAGLELSKEHPYYMQCQLQMQNLTVILLCGMKQVSTLSG